MNGLVLASGIFRERRPVSGRHDLDDARTIFRRLHVKEGYATARDAADRHHGMQHAVRMVVRGIAGLSLHLQHPLAAGQRVGVFKPCRTFAGVCVKLISGDMSVRQKLRKGRSGQSGNTIRRSRRGECQGARRRVAAPVRS